MKKQLTSLIIFTGIIFNACVPEDKVEPAEASTFVRYFNGGNNDLAQQVVQSYTSGNIADGFIILASTEIKVSESATPIYKIKLIKTDLFGNQQWQKFYPAFDGQNPPQLTDQSLKGNNLIALPNNGGYVIVGEDIQNNSPKMMILQVDSLGEKPKQKTLKSAISVRGVGVASNKGGYWAIGSIVNPATEKNVLLTKFDDTTLDSLWSNQYGAGQSTLASRLFINSQSNAYWGGTIQKDNTNTSVRFAKVQANTSNTGGIEFDLPLSNPDYTETGNDFCRYGSGFAVIGTTNRKATGKGDLDIMFKRISDDGTELSSQSFPIDDQQQNETGNSLCSTTDGGLLLLGTIDTQGEIGRGDKDYYLIKINAFGEVEWKQDYGSKFEDNGVNVIQASDGGYVVLGTSSIGRVKTVMLMKTDKTGKIK